MDITSSVHDAPVACINFFWQVGSIGLHKLGQRTVSMLPVVTHMVEKHWIVWFRSGVVAARLASQLRVGWV